MSDLWSALAHSEPMADNLDQYFDSLSIQDYVAAHKVTCPICEDDEAIQSDTSDVVCTRCGTILDTPLEEGAEYRFYNSEGGGGPDPSRCGFPVNHLTPQMSLGTMLISRGNSASSNTLKRYHNWIIAPYRERMLRIIFESLQVRGANAGVSTAVIEEAKELFAQQTASASCRGQIQRDSLLAACLWEGFKRHESHRMPKEVADIFHIPLRQVTKGIKQFQHLFAMRTTGEMKDTYTNPSKKLVAAEPKIEVVESEEVATQRALHRRAIWQRTASRTTSYEDFITPFLSNLSAPRQLESLVRHVCARTEELAIVPENTPPSLTASVIAFCSQELHLNLDVAEIARVCGISAVTIQKCLKRMIPEKEKLLKQ